MIVLDWKDGDGFVDGVVFATVWALDTGEWTWSADDGTWSDFGTEPTEAKARAAAEAWLNRHEAATRA